MRQKVGIVRALQHEPELAILDEPTEGLEPLMQRAFYEILDTLSVFAVGVSASAIAGEPQRGTFEVALARPVSRRVLYLTLLAASFGFIAITIAALLAGSVSGATFAGVVEELAFGDLPLLWLNGVLLFGAFAAIALPASVSLDRLTPALGLTLGIVIAMDVLEVLGSLWLATEVLQPYSCSTTSKRKPS